MTNRERAIKMAAKGATVKEIRQATGVKAQAARNIVNRAAAPAPAPASSGPYNATNMPMTRAAPTAGPLASGYVPLPSSPTPARNTPQSQPSTVSQGLRIAGGGGGISGRQFDTLVGAGKSNVVNSPDQLIRRLDKINDKLAKKDKTGINVKSSAVNKLIRRVGRMNPFERSQLDFGTGALGMQIQGMLGTPGTPGIWRQGQLMGGSAGVEPSFLAKGMDLNPRGKQVVRGVGPQYEVPQRLLGGDETLPPPDDGNNTGGGGDVGGGGGDVGGETPVIPEMPETPIDTSLSSGAGGLDLASWATGFRRAKSSRQKGGKGAQGLASMKKSPFTSWFK